MSRLFHIYIMASKSRVIYAGVTSQLEQRVWQHKNKVIEGFTRKYNCIYLVYFEECTSAVDAIAREKEIKGWRREKKVALIESINPSWEDLSLKWQ
ncbi:MAG: GIY-YIG nuclease family protein [Burkholderiaceae bacterium]